MREVEPYPPGVVKVPARLPGTGFFPGGCGLWIEARDEKLPPMPVGGIMVLGHDFHSEEAFAMSLAHGGEVSTSPGDPNYRRVPTWVALLDLLSEVGIPPRECFFTNAYMGLREEAGTTGRFPGSRDLAFVKRCQDFLIKQIAVQRPRVILPLGAWVPRFIAPLSPQLTPWHDAANLGRIDAVGPVQQSAQFPGKIVCPVVALTHPSLRGPNVIRRRYAGLKGHGAELLMIRDALGFANSNAITSGRDS